MPNKYYVLFLALIISISAALPSEAAAARVIVVKPATQISDGLPGYTHDHSAVATNLSGYSLVVWNKKTMGVDFNSIHGRLIGPKGDPVSADIAINQDTLSDAARPDVDTNGSDLFVVVWSAKNAQGAYDVMAKVYQGTSRVLVPDFVVNTSMGLHPDPTKRMLYPDVAMDSSGNFIVAWDQVDGAQMNEYVRLFDMWGNALSPPVQMNLLPTLYNLRGTPDVDMDDNGNVTVAWSGVDVGGAVGNAVRTFNIADPVWASTQEAFIFIPQPMFQQQKPMIDMNGRGDVVFTWWEKDLNGVAPMSHCWAKFDATTQLWLSPPCEPMSYKGTSLISANGSVITSWSHANNIYLRIHDPLGNALSAAIQLNDALPSMTLRPALGLKEGLTNSRLIISWEGGELATGYSVFYKVLKLVP